MALVRSDIGRFDYVKLSFPANDAETTMRLVTTMEDRFNALRGHFADYPGSFHQNKVYDGRGNWLQTFDIAGALAHKWIYTMPIAEAGNITRLDIRGESAHSYNGRQLDIIFDTARGLNTRNRNLNRKSSRARTKAEGRDAGGDLFSCGSLKSDKYFAIYTKPNEHTAFELKLSGKPLWAMIQTARLKASGRPQGSWEFADFLLLAGQSHLRGHVVDVTGNTLNDWDRYFEGNKDDASVLQSLSPTERVLVLFDSLSFEEKAAAVDAVQQSLSLEFAPQGEATKKAA